MCASLSASTQSARAGVRVRAKKGEGRSPPQLVDLVLVSW